MHASWFHPNVVQHIKRAATWTRAALWSPKEVGNMSRPL